MESNSPRQNVADDIRPSNFIGTLKVTVLRAQHLPQGIFGKAATIDPYIKLRLDNADQAQRGVVHEKAGNDPVFSETFLFELQGSERGINFEIWDETLIKNTELASVFVRIDDLVRNTEQKEEWFNLCRKKHEDGGSILIKAVFVGDSPQGRWPRESNMSSDLNTSSSDSLDTQQKRVSEFTSSDYRPSASSASSSTFDSSSSALPAVTSSSTHAYDSSNYALPATSSSTYDSSSSALPASTSALPASTSSDFDRSFQRSDDGSGAFKRDTEPIQSQWTSTPSQPARDQTLPYYSGSSSEPMSSSTPAFSSATTSGDGSMDMNAMKQHLPVVNTGGNWDSSYYSGGLPDKGGVSSGISGNESLDFSKSDSSVVPQSKSGINPQYTETSGGLGQSRPLSYDNNIISNASNTSDIAPVDNKVVAPVDNKVAPVGDTTNKIGLNDDALALKKAVREERPAF